MFLFEVLRFAEKESCPRSGLKFFVMTDYIKEK